MKEIAERVGRSERTVRRYLQGITPEVHVVAEAPQTVDVFEWIARLLLRLRKRLNLSGKEYDFVIKSLRPVLARKDEWTLARLGDDRDLREEFLWKEFWPPIAREIGTQRVIRRIQEQFGPDS